MISKKIFLLFIFLVYLIKDIPRQGYQNYTLNIIKMRQVVGKYTSIPLSLFYIIGKILVNTCIKPCGILKILSFFLFIV
ncbi:MAG: hypothetical protein A3E91_00880 [Candidatus Moranbacteria bacterium RIFCSPHIGHO2_12_FULL_40_10]|nr:MAG: hypothetical protein A3E91_00880 [Candidatus Moranbacteria bacterium RIFCSPHIGHO2_12_FULL_40_10]